MLSGLLESEHGWAIYDYTPRLVANLPAKTNLRTLAATIKARWVCEQARAARTALRDAAAVNTDAFSSCRPARKPAPPLRPPGH